LLEAIEIQKQPGQSIMRLVELISVAGSLSTLKSKEIAAEKRVEQLHITEAEIKAKVELQNSRSLESFEESVVKGKEAIASVADQTKGEVTRILSEMAVKTRIVNEATAAIMLEKGKLQQQKSYLEPLLALLGLPSQDWLAEKVSPDLVVLLLDNVKLWLEQRFPNSATGVLYDYGTNKFVQTPGAMAIQIVACIEFAINCIKELKAKELKNKTNATGGEK
jgi:hypothetical protein